jgi:hypothetical protein
MLPFSSPYPIILSSTPIEQSNHQYSTQYPANLVKALLDYLIVQIPDAQVKPDLATQH